ncbi:ATP-binding protein [Spirillospora sp. NPDC127200]
MITKTAHKSPEPEKLLATLMIESRPESIKKARDFVGRWFDGQGMSPSVAYIAKTAVTELVTNAHRHGTEPGEQITVRLYLSDAGPVIEVLDPSAKLPTVHPLNLTSEDGRGLAMLSLLVETWGFNAVAGGGKAVWALLKADEA